MVGKRSHTPDGQRMKKFKPSSSGSKSPGKPAQIGKQKAVRAKTGPPGGHKGKRKNPNVLGKWKKKKVYIFKTTKKLKVKTPDGAPSVNNNHEGKLNEGNLAAQKDLNEEKKKKKRRKKKKKKRKVTSSSDDAAPSHAVTDATEGQTENKGTSSSSPVKSGISSESIVKTGKKKKKRKTKKKNKKAKTDVVESPSADGATTEKQRTPAGSTLNVSSSPAGNRSQVVGRKNNNNQSKKKTNNRTEGQGVNPTAATSGEQKSPEKTDDQVVPTLPDSNSNKAVGKSKKRHKKKSTKNAMKPEDISANWKALIPKLDKPKPSKLGTTKQKPTKRPPSEIWFDDVDPELLKTNDLMRSEKATVSSKSDKDMFVIDGAEEGPTRCVAIDCEMVGAGHGGRNNILARVSVVNQYGYCLYDKFVRSREDVTDYRTWVSGVRKKDLDHGEDFLTVQKDVAELLKGKILVGHALQNDMKVLFLDHPKRMVRDTHLYEPFRQMFKSRRPGLKSLVEKILNVKVQQGEHSSVEDAQATMKLYMLNRKKWEASLKMKPTKKSTT